MDERARDETEPRSRTTGRGVQATRIAFGVCLLGAALAIGALHAVVLSIVVCALGATAVFAFLRGEPFRARRPATLLLLACVGLTAYTALQAAPLPIGLLAKLSPASADAWSRALVAVNEPGPVSATLTLDPIATHVQVLRGVCYALAFLIAVRIANRRQGVVFLECALGVTALALAVAALLHPAFGVNKVFGVYEHNPSIAPRHVAPLLNANHLAAYINIGFCIAFASVLSPRPEIPRLVSITVAAVLGAVQLWVASRGGVLGMAAGVVLVVALSRAAISHKQKLSTYIALGVVGAAGIGMAVLSTSEDAWQELAELSDSKSVIFRQALRMVPSFPVFGAGRGAFQSVFPAFRTTLGYSDATNPENVIAQWVTEWGVPFALAGAALIAFALRPQVALARSRAPVGAFAALAVVAVHNLVDFNAEVPAIGMALAACAGICVAGNAEARSRSRIDLWGARPKLVAAACAVCATLAVLWVLPAADKTDDDDREMLHRLALDPKVSAPDFHAALRDAMLRHPAEPYLPFAGAVRASRARDESIMPYVERTFERAQVYGPAHLLLARALFRASPAQARMEYRYAAEQDSPLGEYNVTEALPLVHDFDEAMEIVPSGAARLAVMEGLAVGLAKRLPSTRVRLDEAILAADPRAVQPLKRLAQDAVDDVQAGPAAPWCTGAASADCVHHAEDVIARLEAIDASHCEPHLLRARLLVAAGDISRGLDGLMKAADRVNDRETCLEALAALAHAARDDAHEGVALEKLEHAGCGQSSDCVATWLALAREQEARGEKSHALALYKKVLARAPDDDDALSGEARLAADLGMHADALDAYGKLVQRHPNERQWKDAMDAQRAALFQVKQ
jgi:tetratricopeptide (TPR) repeat protein